jgi:hypothetical protein
MSIIRSMLILAIAVDAVAFTPVAHAAQPCCEKTGKVAQAPRAPSGAGKPAEPCCDLRTNVGGTTGRR